MNMWCRTIYLRYIAQLLTKNLWCTVSKVFTTLFAVRAKIWLVKMFFLFFVPGACQEVKNCKLFKIPYSSVRPIRYGMSLVREFSALISQNLTLISVCCHKVHTTLWKIDIATISEEGKIIKTSMEHFLLLLLRNALKHNLIKFSAARLHVSSDKFWNCLKDLKCNTVYTVCFGTLFVLGHPWFWSK